MLVYDVYKLFPLKRVNTEVIAKIQFYISTRKTPLHETKSRNIANIFVSTFGNYIQFWRLTYRRNIQSTLYVIFYTILFNQNITTLLKFMLEFLGIFFRIWILIGESKYPIFYVTSPCFPRHFSFHIKMRNFSDIYVGRWCIYNPSIKVSKGGRNSQH